MDCLDFLPERIKLHRQRRCRLIRQGYLLGICIVAITIFGYIRQGKISSAKAELAAVDERIDGARRQLVLRNDLERQQAEFAIKQRITEQLGSRVNALDVLAEIGRLLPDSMALINLNLEVIEIRIPVEPADGEGSSRSRNSKDSMVKRLSLSLTGLAPTDVDVANFIGQLSASPLFEDVNMGYAKNVEFRGRVAREFQVNCFVVK